MKSTNVAVTLVGLMLGATPLNARSPAVQPPMDIPPPPAAPSRPPAPPALPRPPGITANDQKIVEEMPALFASFCVDRYPDDAAVAALAKEKGAVAMTPAEVSTYLQRDPGHGFVFTTETGKYALTIEHPPVRACALRRMTPSGLTGALPFRAVVENFAKAHGLTTSVMPVPRMDLPGGITATGFGFPMMKDGKPAEQFILVLTNYHGRPPVNFADDAKGGVGVEVRMARQPLGR